MHWFAGPSQCDWDVAKGAGNRAMLKRQIDDGNCHAVLALKEGEPIGWCRFGPSASFPRLLRSRKLVRPDMADWAIMCFFVKSGMRNGGVARALLDAATREAFERGASSVEGYPVIPKHGHMPAAFAWTGLPTLFEKAGYVALAVDSGARKIFHVDRSWLSIDR